MKVVQGSAKAPSSEASDADILRYLFDLEAIKTLKADYGRIVDGVVSDHGDAKIGEFDAVFAVDSVAEFPNTLGRHEGREAIKALFSVDLATTRSCMWHSFHSPIIRIDGDVAKGQWTIVARVKLRGAEAEPPSIVYGRYSEDYVRTVDGWRIKNLLFKKE
jgi:SnoaL-like domain